MAELAEEDRIDLDMLYSAKFLSNITRRIANLVSNLTYCDVMYMCIVCTCVRAHTNTHTTHTQTHTHSYNI